MGSELLRAGRLSLSNVSYREISVDKNKPEWKKTKLYDGKLVFMKKMFLQACQCWRSWQLAVTGSWQPKSAAVRSGQRQRHGNLTSCKVVAIETNDNSELI